MEFIKYLLLIVGGILGLLIFLIALGAYVESDRAAQAKAREESRAAESTLTANEFVQISCNDRARGSFVLPCDHAVFAGSTEFGGSVSDSVAPWFNVCGWSGRVPALYNWRGECVQPQPKNADQFRFANLSGYQSGGNSFHRHRRYVLDGTLLRWSKETNRIELDRDELHARGRCSEPTVGLCLVSLLGRRARSLRCCSPSSPRSSQRWGTLGQGSATDRRMKTLSRRRRFGSLSDSGSSFLFMAWDGGELVAQEEAYVRSVEGANQHLAAQALPSGGFRPIGFDIPSPTYPQLLDVQPLSTQAASFLGGLSFIVLHIAVLCLRPVVCRCASNALYGYYHVFVPSKHLPMYRRNPKDPLGPPGRLRISVPSVEDLLRGLWSAFLAPFRVASHRNQARKARAMAEVMRAQAEELDADATLFTEAARREEFRMEDLVRRRWK